MLYLLCELELSDLRDSEPGRLGVLRLLSFMNWANILSDRVGTLRTSLLSPSTNLDRFCNLLARWVT